MSNSRLNPQLVISEYFDKLINLIDIHTEEQLEFYSNGSNIKKRSIDRVVDDDFSIYDYHIPFKKLNIKLKDQTLKITVDCYSKNYDYKKKPSKDINMSQDDVINYLNSTRDELIRQVSLAQVDAFKRYEEIREELKCIACSSKDNDEKVDEIKRRAFLDKSIGIIVIERLLEGNFSNVINDNKSPFQLYLVYLDFYLNRNDQHLFSLMNGHFSGYMYFGQKYSFDFKCSLHNLPNNISTTFDKVEKTYIQFSAEQVDIGDQVDESLFSSIKSLELENISHEAHSGRPNMEIKCLASFLNLRRLKLNDIQLFDYSLQGLSRLDFLGLVDCDFENFKRESFRHVTNVESLLIHNPIDSKQISLHELAKLQIMYVSDCSNHTFVESAGQTLTMLIIENFLEKEDPVEFFKTLRHQNVKYLQLNIPNLDEFKGQWLSGFPSIEALSLRSNRDWRDEHKTIDFSDDFLSRDLESLEFYFYKMPSLSNVFSKLSNLKHLKLVSCEIGFNPDTFSGLENLKTLEMVYTNLESSPNDLKIPTTFFMHLTNLTSLKISHSSLETFDPEIFVHMPNLVTLNLKSNYIEVLTKEMFVHLKNLKHLNLRDNHIERLDDDVFSHLQKLQSLNLSENGDSLIKKENLSDKLLEQLNKLEEFHINSCTSSPIDSESEYHY